MGLILAGGQGKRLGGRDKALVVLRGRPLLAHLLDRMTPQLGSLALSANGDAGRFADYGLTILPDHHPGKGPLAGVHAGLVWAKGQGTKALITVAVDCPFLPADLVARLVAASGPDLARPALAHANHRDHPTMALWPIGLLAPLQDHLDRDLPPRLGQFLTAHGAANADFGTHAGFANINTPDELAQSEGPLA